MPTKLKTKKPAKSKSKFASACEPTTRTVTQAEIDRMVKEATEKAMQADLERRERLAEQTLLFEKKFSPKQLLFLKTPFKQFNLLSGTTGSGKSFIVNLKWYHHICNLPKGTQFLMTGNTFDSLYKNVISELLKIDDGVNLTYTKSPGRIKTKNGALGFLVGVNDFGAEKRVRGGSLGGGWYGDEITLCDELSFNMCLGRCRGINPTTKVLENMPAVWTNNPDFPEHFIKRRFIDNRENIDMSYYEFTHADNPTITQKWVDSLTTIYSGSDYDRMVLGLWCGNAETIVVPEFGVVEKDIVRAVERPKHYRLYGSLDIGYEDHSFYLLGYWHFDLGKYIVEGEFDINNANSIAIAAGINTCETLFPMKPYIRVSDHEPQFQRDMRDLHKIDLTNVNKTDAEAALSFVRTCIQNKQVLIHPRCTTLIAQLRSAHWNKARTAFAKDPIHGHYDGVDSLKYLLRSIDKSHNPYPNVPIELQNRPDVEYTTVRKLPDQNHTGWASLQL